MERNSPSFVLIIPAWTHIQVLEAFLCINYTTQQSQFTKMSGLGFQYAFHLVSICLELTITHQTELHQKVEDLGSGKFLGSLPLSRPM